MVEETGTCVRSTIVQGCKISHDTGNKAGTSCRSRGCIGEQQMIPGYEMRDSIPLNLDYSGVFSGISIDSQYFKTR